MTKKEEPQINDLGVMLVDKNMCDAFSALMNVIAQDNIMTVKISSALEKDNEFENLEKLVDVFDNLIHSKGWCNDPTCTYNKN